MEQSVPKRRHIKFRQLGITQKKADNCRYEFGHRPVSVPVFNSFHKIPGYVGCLSCHSLPVPIATSELHSLISSPREVRQIRIYTSKSAKCWVSISDSPPIFLALSKTKLFLAEPIKLHSYQLYVPVTTTPFTVFSCKFWASSSSSSYYYYYYFPCWTNYLRSIARYKISTVGGAIILDLEQHLT